MENNKVRQPEIIFLILALVYGISFLFITPPFQVPDEDAHFYKAFYVSEGHILPDKSDKFYPSISYTINNFIYMKHHYKKKTSPENISAMLNLPLNTGQKEYHNISNIVIYPPIPYLASGMVIFIEKSFNISPLILMYSGRIVNLLVWIVLIFFAIRIVPVHKWVFLLLSLMPMTLFEAASLSADSFTIGLSFLTIALFLKMALINERVSLNDILLLFALIFTLSLTKQGYALLLLLIFTIPKNKFNTEKTRIKSFTAIGMFTLLVTGIWNYLFKGLYSATTHASPSGQISYILSNPSYFPSILVNTLILRFKEYLITFVGNLGWLDMPLPGKLVLVYLLVIVLVSLMEKNDIKINLKNKFIFLTSFSIISLLIFVFIYITWNPVGLNSIGGVQGRYFTPIAPLLFLLLYNNKEKIKIGDRIINITLNTKMHLFITLFLIGVLSFTVIKLIFRYYIP